MISLVLVYVIALVLPIFDIQSAIQSVSVNITSVCRRGTIKEYLLAYCCSLSCRKGHLSGLVEVLGEVRGVVCWERDPENIDLSLGSIECTW